MLICSRRTESEEDMLLSLAGLTVEVKNKYEYIEKLAADYTVSEGVADFSVEVTDTDIERERELSEYEFGNGYLESIAAYRKIAERLPEYGAVVFHGAVIAEGGEAYAITARSGVGKTTHVSLWQRAFGEKVYILNGDKPILRVIDGKVYASGTPWRGKEGYGVPGMLPLTAVGFLKRADEPSAVPISKDAATVSFASQIYIPSTPRGASLALATLGKIISSIGLYEIRANMDVSSAIVSHDAFKNNKKI